MLLLRRGCSSHQLMSCQEVAGSESRQQAIQVSKPVPRTLTKIKLNSVYDIEALIDSGADESLMDWGLARKLGIESEPLVKSIRAKSLNGK